VIEKGIDGDQNKKKLRGREERKKWENEKK